MDIPPPPGKHPKYFEGILQIRNYSQKLKDFVNKEIRKEEIYVAQRVKVNDGLNISVSSNKFLLALAKKLKQNFNGELKISRSIYSRDRMTQKEIWRVTVLFTEVNLKRGQIVNVRGEDYKISQLGEKVQCVNVKSGKKKLFTYKEVQ